MHAATVVLLNVPRGLSDSHSSWSHVHPGAQCSEILRLPAVPPAGEAHQPHGHFLLTNWRLDNRCSDMDRLSPLPDDVLSRIAARLQLRHR